ncbi:MAG: FAD-dependent oxidoreductase [Rickettsiaceae bacterium H1]|nr:FAD-dependent oxidoreductase [Rickettsiaceae bacterium H1]
MRDADDYDSEIILQLAVHIENFISRLFKIEREIRTLKEKNNAFANIHECKRLFIQRYALKNYAEVENFPEIEDKLKKILRIDSITEKLYADTIMNWWENKENYREEIELAAKYAVWMVKHDKNSVLFNLPEKLDYDNLIDTENYLEDSVTIIKSPIKKERKGFKLTDPGLNTISAVDNADYCIFCHKRGKDSCSKGLCNKDGSYKTSPTKTKLTGCPLDEKISEMNLLKSQGYNIAALAVITIDNPMCAATGHRICNDCMRSCIYQKQTPVNIPGVETNILSEVLSLPYGFEIYSLLTKWNPLNKHNPIPKKNTDYKVLVVGSGPAGFTMVHYLLNEGHTVVAIDGLKIEPLPVYLTGANERGKKHSFDLIKDVNILYEELDERVIYGFGGVTEYGITVRWNKNCLKIIRLILERREGFELYGGVRFGSNITYRQAIKLGFNHIALAIGAGSPNIIDIKNNLANGVKMASDFLMSLQLGGAFQAESITNLQIRMPIVVIGGGLTAIDTATEALHYYAVQVEKFASRYNILVKQSGPEYMESAWTPEEKEIAKELLEHEKLLSKTKNKIDCLKKIGGVKVLYRKTLIQSPAYRLNHEEVEKAFAEGVEFIEKFIPDEILTDRYGNTKGIKGYIEQEEKIISARTVLIAAGTKPNSVLNKEDPTNFHDFINKPPDNVTVLGDVNPKYSGSVVKAIASSKNSYQAITEKLEKLVPKYEPGFLRHLKNKFSARIVDMAKLTPSIYEIIVKSPLSANNFSPGQFYRLQNYEVSTKNKMLIEPIALTGAKVDKVRGTISLIVLDVGSSSKLCSYLKKDEQVVLMGPTGEPTEIPYEETVMLIGGGLGNAVLFSIGQAMRKNRCKVLYFAGYKKTEDSYKITELEDAADIIVWACNEKKIKTTRKQDFSFHSNIIQAIDFYRKQKSARINLSEVDRVIAIGSDSMMSAVNNARKTIWKTLFKESTKFIASINSPMQCMMKEICAQCLQKHVDPVTKRETFVYSCSGQDQDMNSVDFCHLKQRLKQNSIQEKLMAKSITTSYL